jgi:hypothetical protein
MPSKYQIYKLICKGYFPNEGGVLTERIGYICESMTDGVLDKGDIVNDDMVETLKTLAEALLELESDVFDPFPKPDVIDVLTFDYTFDVKDGGFFHATDGYYHRRVPLSEDEKVRFLDYLLVSLDENFGNFQKKNT